MNLHYVSATDFRPITVLSLEYSVYGKASFGSLLQWQEGWVSDAIFGCRKGKNAESLALQISMDLESKGYTHHHQYVAGVSYDCWKAFDLDPIEIALAVMKQRGSHIRILNALSGMCQRRVFRLCGAVGDWWGSYNGLIQGDHLSMIILNCPVTCMIEAASQLPFSALCVSSYADDVSAVVRGESSAKVRDGLRAVHVVVRGYVASGCGYKKCYTGVDGAKGLLHHRFEK